MSFLKNKTSRVLIIIMGILVLMGIVISNRYYTKTNDSIDPRVADARLLYNKYNEYAQSSNYDSVFILLDTIERIYASLEHYKESYEIGVLYNNRAATYLTLALYNDSIKNNPDLQDSLINLSQACVNKSINNYTNWLEKFNNKTPDEIQSIVESDFFDNLDIDNKEVYLNKRVKEIQEAQEETRRRLSVSYTNLGIILRHKLDYKASAEHYKKAIELWDRNLTAKNNLNILLGRPLKKQNFIQKMFPPDKN